MNAAGRSQAEGPRMKVHVTTNYRSGFIKVTWPHHEEGIQVPVQRLEFADNVQNVGVDLSNLLRALGFEVELEHLT